MSTGPLRFFAFGILAAGVCAAIPFYQQPPLQSAPDRVWHKTPRRSGDLTLQVGEPAPLLPPAALPAFEKSAEIAQPEAPSVRHLPSLGALPLPDLAPEYRPTFREPESGTEGTQFVLHETPGREDAELAENGACEPCESAPSVLAEDRIESTPSGPQRSHRVIDGDSLEELARKYLGSQDRAEEIFQANRGLLQHPDILPIGVTLAIPTGNGALPLSSNSTAVGVEGEQSPSPALQLVPLRDEDRMRLKARLQ